MNVNEAMLTGNADSDPSDPDADLNATYFDDISYRY